MANIKIVVDAHGADDAPAVVLDGVTAALAERDDFEVILVGLEETVCPFAQKHERVQAKVCTQLIEMGEHGAMAVRKKKDSSIVIGCNLVKEGAAQGFFSAGSTGACMAAATLKIGRIKGVKRPALVTVIPSPAAKTVFCDIGANADCKPEYLVQFAKMASVYAQITLGVKNPRIGLLNIGEEKDKGSEFAQECHKLMEEEVSHFAGNAEGRDIALGGFDVIVCDGFTGNVVLKTIEGVSKALFGALKETFMNSTKSKIAALMLKNDLSALKASLSADEFGGAQLLGIKGVCLIGHGSSNAKAIKNGILATVNAVEGNMPAKLEAALFEQKNDTSA